MSSDNARALSGAVGLTYTRMYVIADYCCQNWFIQVELKKHSLLLPSDLTPPNNYVPLKVNKCEIKIQVYSRLDDLLNAENRRCRYNFRINCELNVNYTKICYVLQFLVKTNLSSFSYTFKPRNLKRREYNTCFPLTK